MLIFTAALNSIYPEHKLVEYKHLKFGHIQSFRGSKSQNFLLRALETLFPQEPILSNFKFPIEKTEKNDGLQRYEFDVFLPNLALAFEYQGTTHYISSHIFGRATARQKSDQIKAKFARDTGISLLSIPF